MITRMMIARISTSIAALVLAALIAAPAPSANAAPATPPQEATDQLLLRQQLRGQPGTDVVMLTVDYPPGGATAPHEHPGYTFAYVLQGAIVSKVGSQPARTYTTGQFFTELPHQPHLVSRNASRGAPARMLVFMIVPHDTVKLTTSLTEPR